MDFTIFRYSLGFYNFHLVTLIQPFSGSFPNSFSVLAQILPFPGIRWDFTIFRYSLGFYHFHLVTLIQPFFGTRPNSFSVLARILPFPGITLVGTRMVFFTLHCSRKSTIDIHFYIHRILGFFIQLLH